jgi:hypothetical protein
MTEIELISISFARGMTFGDHEESFGGILRETSRQEPILLF